MSESQCLSHCLKHLFEAVSIPSPEGKVVVMITRADQGKLYIKFIHPKKGHMGEMVQLNSNPFCDKIFSALDDAELFGLSIDNLAFAQQSEKVMIWGRDPAEQVRYVQLTKDGADWEHGIIPYEEEAPQILQSSDGIEAEV